MQEMALDVAAVSGLDAVPTILEVICHTTGMGFAAVARVTEDRWVACAVRDVDGFGLVTGSELPVDATLCKDLRGSRTHLAIDNVSEDDRFCGHSVPQRFGFKSYIAVPIVLGNGELFGTLCAVDRKPARIDTPETIGMFLLFARLIALQLDQRTHVADLEAAIAHRTNALRADREALRGLAVQLQRVREDERALLAREVHDELGQSLTALKIEFATMRRLLRQSQEPAVIESLASVDAMDGNINDMLEGVQRILAQLRPLALDTLGFPAAAARLVSEFGQRAKIRASFDGDPEATLPDGAPIVLFRVLQEALTNVSRHADATSVTVSFYSDERAIVLRISDDGCGITTEGLENSTGLGIRGMQERLRAVGGLLQLNARSTGGTEVIASIPWPLG